jgi:hypothetical protein
MLAATLFFLGGLTLMTLPLNLSLLTHVLNSKTVTGDLNELTTSGFYYVQQPTNSPTHSWVHAIVNSSDDKKHVIQLVLPDNSSEGAYYRDQTSGSWSTWQHVVEHVEFDTYKKTVQDEFDTINAALQAKYLPGTEMTNLNGTNETTTNFAWRLDFGNFSLLFVNLWINDFTGNEKWKSYKNAALPKSFLNGATKIKAIPDQKTEDSGAIVNWKLDTNGQLSVDTRGTAIGEHVGIGFVGLFLLIK